MAKGGTEITLFEPKHAHLFISEYELLINSETRFTLLAQAMLLQEYN